MLMMVMPRYPVLLIQCFCQTQPVKLRGPLKRSNRILTVSHAKGLRPLLCLVSPVRDPARPAKYCMLPASLGHPYCVPSHAWPTAVFARAVLPPPVSGPCLGSRLEKQVVHGGDDALREVHVVGDGRARVQHAVACTR